ncbi:MAG: hypothetical protein Fur0024_3960 [Patescibacteria group bacterium]
MPNLLSSHDISFLIDLIFAIIAGFLIGGERELPRKDAGISTHMMVVIGAMLFTYLSSFADPASKSRIAAQVVSGIGFLGAGMIMKKEENRKVSNLTTAASIWFAGGIGMAIGFGYHFIAMVSTLASVLIPRIPKIRKRK